jgi:hypothetical protein
VLVQAIGLPGVALGAAIPSVLIVMLVMPLVACPIVGVRLPAYYVQAYVRPLIAVVPYAAAAWWVNSNAPAANLAIFFLHMIALTAVYLPCAFFIVLNQAERRFVLARMGLRLRGV